MSQATCSRTRQSLEVAPCFPKSGDCGYGIAASPSHALASVATKKTKPRRALRGFTLLELILALSLAVVLTVLIGEAMTFYVSNMETRDQQVRRVQLATSVMKMISDDLKASLAIPEFDDAALAEFLSTAGTGGGGETSEPTSMLFDVEEEPALEEDLDLVVGTVFLERPGLIGNQYQLMFDLSRTPRLEEFQPLLAPSNEGLVDIPSDIKTVTYFVQPPGTTGVLDPLTQMAAGEPSSFAGGGNGGLVRRQLDRLATKYALETGNTASLNMTGDLLAPEVLAIEFSYWDGFLWQIEWNSDEQKALPLAVRVRLTVGQAGADPQSVDTSDSSEVRVFQQIVRLPMGRIVEEEELAEDDLSGVGI